MNTVTESCPHCRGSGQQTRPCCDPALDLQRIEHPLNVVDFDNAPHGSRQGYQVYRCTKCNTLWGCRFQWHPGTGHDDSWAVLDEINPKRHY
jgi:hypothetical protein